MLGPLGLVRHAVTAQVEGDQQELPGKLRVLDPPLPVQVRLAVPMDERDGRPLRVAPFLHGERDVIRSGDGMRGITLVIGTGSMDRRQGNRRQPGGEKA